jgi:hypothetical protein
VLLRAVRCAEPVGRGSAVQSEASTSVGWRRDGAPGDKGEGEGCCG